MAFPVHLSRSPSLLSSPLLELDCCSFWILSLVLGGGNGWSRGSSPLEFEFDLLFSSSRWWTNNPNTIPNSCLVMVCWFPNLLCKSVGSLVIGSAPVSNPSSCLCFVGGDIVLSSIICLCLYFDSRIHTSSPRNGALVNGFETVIQFSLWLELW